jgi:hypothetical protein
MTTFTPIDGRCDRVPESLMRPRRGVLDMGQAEAHCEALRSGLKCDGWSGLRSGLQALQQSRNTLLQRELDL